MSILRQIPKLFYETDTDFSSQGLGALTDAISCQVREELNGAYELTMVYPIAGIHFDEIASRSIIVAKPNPVSDPVPFRVYAITKPLNGRCTIRAAHLSYDLDGIPVAPFSSASVTGALSGLTTYAATACPFSFTTDLATSADFSVPVPASIRSRMGGTEGSIIDVYGGEWVYDYNGNPYSIKLASARGSNQGVTIRYGKNMTSLEQEENISAVYTGVYPYYTDIEGNVITLPEQIVSVSGSFSFSRILALDLTAEFETAPDEDQLRNAANAYITRNNIGVPTVAIRVGVIMLGTTDQYKGAALRENIELGDTVEVYFSDLGINTSARCVATIYDPLTAGYEVEIGSARSTIAETIASMNGDVTTLVNGVTTPITAAIHRATDRIVGNLGGYVVLRDSDGDGDPDELLIMDTPDVNTATKIWRFNQQGLGYSSNGYNGTYGLAMTADGEIVADYIMAGHMQADRITMGAVSGDELTDYFRVYLDANSRAVVELGADENNIVLRLQNDRISFYDTQGTELAYFSDNSFKIVTLQSFILQGLKIAVLDNGAYGFMAV